MSRTSSARWLAELNFHVKLLPALWNVTTSPQFTLMAAVDRLAVEHAVVPSGSTCLGSAHGEHKAGDQGGGGNGAVHESSYFGGRVTRESHLRRSPWKEL